MFRKIIVISLALFVFLAAGLVAQSDGLSSDGDANQLQRERKIENWYHMFTFGYVPMVRMSTEYGGALPSDTFGPSVSIELIRVYWSLGSNLLLGTSINNSFSTAGSSGESAMMASLFSVSALYYFDYIGNGLYLRGDIGAGMVSLASGSSYSASYGFIAGLGYALPISQETSFVFEAGYRYIDMPASYNNANLGTLYCSIGWLY